MTESHPFRDAVEARDFETIESMLAPDVVFRSPILFKPFEGSDVALEVMRAAEATLEGFGYTGELHGENRVGLTFKGRVGEYEIEGVDFLTFGDDGLIEDFTVMMRPQKAVLAFSEAMATRLAAAGVR